MPAQPERKLSDAELDRLARELFAEVRAQHAEKPQDKADCDATADVGVDLLDWLLDGGDGDGGGDGHGGD
ncbi:hypothetical protein MKK75_02420 [Methylobacterium sp. J-030]|uniref:hypothetical protein n=1 Tax=Methylobacterium sp. J-030 TaxID=2836627 RepID=UPI001FBB1121|nr:hypothetical protein [Methylobacterium sp. J-030]MCJ2067668.1 hypothetical protein [Methylobacterium sp. J-030]